MFCLIEHFICMMKCSPSLVSRSLFISLFKTQKRETVTSYMSPECYILRTFPTLFAVCSWVTVRVSHCECCTVLFSLCAWFGRASSYIIWILASHPPPLFLAAAHCPAMFTVPDLELWISNYRKDSTCNMRTTELLKVWQKIFGWSQIHLFD